MPQSREFTITVSRPMGYVPRWFLSDYPSHGNKEGSGDMRNIDSSNPSYITQGRDMAALTNGTQAAAVTTLIKGMNRNAVSSGVAYGVGGAKLYKFSSSTVTNAGDWPHTIDKATVTGEDGEDVCHYKAALYYSYNHSGSAGDIGKYNLDATFDDDWGSTTPTGAAALQSAPHQMIVGGDDCMYIANGIYIAKYDGTTFTADALDFWDDSQVASISWNNNRVIAAVNRPNISGANANQSAVYRWSGYDGSWEGDPIEINGRIGALYTKNGTTYIWYENFINGTAIGIFGYLNGMTVVPLRSFPSPIPLYYQVGDANDSIIWLSGQRIYSYGPLSEVSAELFQSSSALVPTGGGLASPFGLIMTASTYTTSYRLAIESGYSIDSWYTTKIWQLSGAGEIAQLDSIVVWTEQMDTNAKCTTILRYDGGKSNFNLSDIAYATTNSTRHIIGSKNLPQVEDCRLEFLFAGGSTVNPVKIKGFQIKGHYVPRK